MLTSAACWGLSLRHLSALSIHLLPHCCWRAFQRAGAGVCGSPACLGTLGSSCGAAVTLGYSLHRGSQAAQLVPALLAGSERPHSLPEWSIFPLCSKTTHISLLVSLPLFFSPPSLPLCLHHALILLSSFPSATATCGNGCCFTAAGCQRRCRVQKKIRFNITSLNTLLSTSALVTLFNMLCGRAGSHALLCTAIMWTQRALQPGAGDLKWL